MMKKSIKPSIQTADLLLLSVFLSAHLLFKEVYGIKHPTLIVLPIYWLAKITVILILHFKRKRLEKENMHNEH